MLFSMKNKAMSGDISGHQLWNCTERFFHCKVKRPIEHCIKFMYTIEFDWSCFISIKMSVLDVCFLLWAGMWSTNLLQFSWKILFAYIPACFYFEFIYNLSWWLGDWWEFHRLQTLVTQLVTWLSCKHFHLWIQCGSNFFIIEYEPNTES